jgi:hypothetical protein
MGMGCGCWTTEVVSQHLALVELTHLILSNRLAGPLGSTQPVCPQSESAQVYLWQYLVESSCLMLIYRMKI